MKVFVPQTAMIIFAAVVSSGCLASQGYYTWPAAYEDTLVFTAEGDLWRLDAGSIQALRLTTHEELESQAAISPDGSQVAFVASFAGLPQVYVMPLAGGKPRQVTFEPVGVDVRGWAPDGRILYTSRDMEGSNRVLELRLVDPATAEVERIPLRYATDGTFNDDGSVLFFTRHGVSTVSDNARLYRGGGMSQLWRYSMGSNREARRLAEDFNGPVEYPMYWDGRIFFISDASGEDNIWSMSAEGRNVRQHSNLSGWRIQGASLSEGKIYYQRGADLYYFDIARGEQTAIAIDLATDHESASLKWLDNPLSYLSDTSMSANGERVALTSRGSVALAGTSQQRRVDLPVGADVRVRGATPGPEADWVYAIVDAGEQGEIWRYAADGSTSEQLTSGSDAYIWRVDVSDDGRWLVYSDKKARLWKFDMESRTGTRIMESPEGADDPFGGFDFSPGGRYLAYHNTISPTGRTVVVVHDLVNGNTHSLTTSKYSSGFPAFSPDGQWLYFLSERNFEASPSNPWGDRTMGVNFDRRSQVYALALDADARFPFASPDELAPENDDDARDKPTEEAAADDTADDTADEQDRDWIGAADRLYQLPLPAGNYSNLQVTGDRVYVLESAGSTSSLKSTAITYKNPMLVEFATDVGKYEISADGKNIFYVAGGEPPRFFIVPAGEKPPGSLDGFGLQTSGWRIPVNQAEEWRQLFMDSWRLHRDYSFDPTMRGVDWNEVRDRLYPLTSRLGHRSELSDLQAQMAWELGILHSQVRGGDIPEDDDNGSVSSLGAHYAVTTTASGEPGIRITDIYRGDKDLPGTLGPLERPGVDVATGDIIVAVNNRRVTSRLELEQALMFQAGKQVLMETRRGDEKKLNVVMPVSTGEEGRLRYLDWVGRNAAIVADASDGEIGYLHLQAMGGSDLGSFARDFFAQNHLDGMIIDVRDNNGGNVDSFIIEQFMRRVWAYWQFFPGTEGYGNMQEAFRGHLAVLINAGTYSDGESFSAGIKALGIAPLIGTRTAGAGIWLTGRNRLADGGISRIAEFPQYGLDGRWLVEGNGIGPDIEVEAEPHALFMGNDQQLAAAISYLQQKIIDEPIPDLVPTQTPPLGESGRDVTD